jgi:CarD family transcriptional regulator
MEGTTRTEFAVGDLVVYASHGIGRVTSVSHQGAERQQVIVIACSSGLTVTLPIALACESLRPLADESELAHVGQTLRADAPEPERVWSKRLRATREKLAGGSASGLAEIVRDGAQRERETARRQGTPTPPSERELYVKARKLLIDEIGLSRGIDAVDAELWIDDQLAAQTDLAGAPLQV